MQGKIAKATIAFGGTEKCVRLDSMAQAQAKFRANRKPTKAEVSWITAGQQKVYY